MFVASRHHIVLKILTWTILKFTFVALLVESVEVKGGAAGLLNFFLNISDCNKMSGSECCYASSLMP